LEHSATGEKVLFHLHVELTPI
jgi:hypothetical protein